MFNQIHIPQVGYTIAADVLTLVGLWFFRRGRKLRIGTQPHCRTCDYLLIGNISERCPECGSLTKANIIHGEVHRSRRMIALSLAVWAVALVFIGAVAFPRKVISIFVPIPPSPYTGPPYEKRLTTLVMRDLRTGTGRPVPKDKPYGFASGHGWPSENFDLARVALEELILREKAGRLPKPCHDEIIEMALAANESFSYTAPVNYVLMQYLTDRVIAGGLTSAQFTRFYQAALGVKLTVRPIVLEGDEIPFQLFPDHWTAGSSVMNGGWAVYYRYQLVEIDDQKASPSPKWLSVNSRPVLSNTSDDGTVPCQRIGHHILNVTLSMHVHHGNSVYSDQGALIHSTTVKLSVPFEVVPPSPESNVALIDNASIKPKLLAAIKPRELKYSLWHPGDLFGVFDVDPIPINIAFEIFARYDDHEYPIGHVAKAAGNTPGSFRCDSQLDKSLPKPPASIDLVFRTSAKVARASTTLYQIWDGELVLKNVPIEDAGRR